MNKINLIFFVLLFIYFSVEASAEDKIRVVATEHQLLHYEFEGKIKGPTAEIIMSVLKQAKLSAKIEFMPWPRGFNTTLKNPNTIILSMIRTPERENKFHWLGIVSKLARVFISIKNNVGLDVTTAQEAKNKLVAVTRNSNSYHELKAKGFSENKNLYVVSSSKEAFKLLTAGKVDLVYNDPNAVNEYLVTNNIDQQNLKFNTIAPKDRRDSYIAININSNPAIVNKLKSAMKTFQQTDRYLYLLESKGDE